MADAPVHTVCMVVRARGGTDAGQEYGGRCGRGQDRWSFSASGGPAASLRRLAGAALVVPCRAHSAAFVIEVLRAMSEGCTPELF